MTLRIPRALPWTNKTLQLAFLAGGLSFVLLSIHIGFVAAAEQRQEHGASRHSRLQRVPPPLSHPISPSTLSKLENKATTNWISQIKNVTTVTDGGVIEHEMAPKNRLMFPKFKQNVDNNSNQQQQLPVLAPTLQSPDGGAFVHMGKTGGSAISLLLRNDRCRDSSTRDARFERNGPTNLVPCIGTRISSLFFVLVASQEFGNKKRRSERNDPDKHVPIYLILCLHHERS